MRFRMERLRSKKLPTVLLDRKKKILHVIGLHAVQFGE